MSWVFELNILGTRGELWQLNVEHLLTFLGALSITKTKTQLSKLFAIILLFEQETATNIIFQVIISLFVPLPLCH